MLIPSELTPEWLTSPNYPQPAVETQEQASTCVETPIERDITAWPTDAGNPPFTVGGVYRFRDIWNRERTALIYTEQHARVDGCWWHVSELPAGAVAVGTFTPDPALIADARRFARELENSQRWS